jgi:hypothetical protein
MDLPECLHPGNQVKVKKAFAIILLVIAEGPIHAEPDPQTRPLALAHATVIDARGGPAAVDTTVLIGSPRSAPPKA